MTLSVLRNVQICSLLAVKRISNNDFYVTLDYKTAKFYVYILHILQRFLQKKVAIQQIGMFNEEGDKYIRS